MKFIRRLYKKIDTMGIKSKQVIFNSIGAFTIRGISLIVSLLTLPAYIHYFDNQEILGFWFTILSVLNWILTFDLGIGNGLRNRLVTPLVNQDMLTAKKYISSAYVLSSIILVAGLILGYRVFQFIDWNKFFNIPLITIHPDTLLKVVKIIFAGIMLQFLLKIVTSVLYAMQRSAIPGLLNLITNAILLLFIINSNSNNVEKNIELLAKVYFIAVNVPLLVASIIIFSKELRGCIPNPFHFNYQYAKDIFKLGGMFFCIQIMYMLIANTNEFYITWLAGPEYVVDFQIYSKLFLLIGTMFNIAIIPIWSAVTRAYSEGDLRWLNNTFKKLRLFALIAIIGEFTLILFLQFIVNIWLGEKTIEINYLYAFLFAISGSTFIWNGVISSIINGIGKLKIQFIYLTIGAIINFPIAYILYKLTGIWIVIVIANIISILPYCIIQPVWIRKYIKFTARR